MRDFETSSHHPSISPFTTGTAFIAKPAAASNQYQETLQSKPLVSDLETHTTRISWVSEFNTLQSQAPPLYSAINKLTQLTLGMDLIFFSPPLQRGGCSQISLSQNHTPLCEQQLKATSSQQTRTGKTKAQADRKIF